MNPTLLILIFIIFAFIIISYMIEKLDFVAISLLGCFIAATITGISQSLQIQTFISFIEWEAIIIILSMSIITKIAQDSNVLEYIAVKMFKVSKGNQRIFFYLLCILSTLLASIISDVVVVLILAPVVIRLCHFLKIRAGTYLLGMTVCINIGSIITPFSSGENIIISTYFNIGTSYFFQYYWIFAFSLLFLTTFLLDAKMLSKEPKIEAQQKSFVLELVDADVMIKNKFIFYFNSIAIIITVILFVILPYLYLTAAISALILVLVNQRYTNNKMSDILQDIEWEIIFFFISLYVVVGCLLEAGFQEIISTFPFADFNLFFLSLIILLSVSFLSGAVANTPTALIFIPIVGTLIDLGFAPIPLLFAFIIGINLGGNFLPQGAACDMMTLKIAQDSGVENFDKKRLIKYGGAYAIFHLVSSIGYLLLLVFFFG
ncbi:MAG: SLC13 family permease [Promethearchaeia archaeon]